MSQSETVPPSAYLVIREDHSWRNVHRLTAGQVTTIGRAPTNRVVLNDDICSRNHCEIFLSDNYWTLRDLGSRNGTSVDGQKIHSDWPLESGQLIKIGSTILGFTLDLALPLPVLTEEKVRLETDTALQGSVLDDDEEDEWETELQIVHRQQKTEISSKSSMIGRDRTSRELARLYRLALEMGQAQGGQELTEMVLEGLLVGTHADIGAILLIPEGIAAPSDPGQLHLIAYRSEGEQSYQRVSRQLSQIVIQQHEAVLARDVANDSRLVTRDSLGRIQAESVICAPIRKGEQVLGLVHLYSTNPDNSLEKEDLEFTHAVADQLAIALSHLKEKESLETGLARARGENATLREQLGFESELVGESQSISRLKETVKRIAPTDATVLIRGESGVGKELVARAIHFGSPRKPGPFVTMNCAALSESLLESELFGHEQGSFTGATARKIGKFEQAHNGTLFLDEVGEMGPAIQAKFLRVLEGHPFERVGGGITVHVNVRVVAATNRNLEKMVEEQKFRADLYFRLHVVQVTVQPLRERKLDIAILARHFLKKFSEKTGRLVRGFEADALLALQNYDWPGNVRELQNTIERTVILCPHEIIRVSDIQLSHLGGNFLLQESGEAARQEYQEWTLEKLEKEHILATLEFTDWNKSRAAQILGIERSTLDRKLKKYRVRRPSQA